MSDPIEIIPLEPKRIIRRWDGRRMRNHEGMQVDPAQLPDKLMEPAMQPGQPPPSRSPDAADLALAKIATPWVGLHHTGRDEQLAMALAAWLAARGIY